MALSLLATKTFLPPSPEYLVVRSRLDQRLDAALRNHHRLILVSAPAGSGKSSLLADWARRRTVALAWLSLEPGDDDPLQFWSYVLAALRGRFPKPVQAILEDLNATPGIPPTMLPDLINLLYTLEEPLVIALDDYHAIENREIHDGILYLLEHLPATVSLAITTRIDPPWPLHRWRARGQLTEIRAADLRFTLAEAGEFLTSQMGLPLEASDVQKLEERTEGWATGLQLAAISMQGRSDLKIFIEQFSGSHHFVLEYLMNEVLDRQDPGLQSFLVSTSILESLCAPLCEAVLGQSGQDAAGILASLERANLFLIPLDDDRVWFRYHHLFASFLSQRLQRKGLDAVHDLHRRAAGWYDANGMPDQAIDHALAAGDPALAVQAIRNHWRAPASDGRTREVAGWLEKLPAQLLAEDGQLSLLYAWMLVSIGKTKSIEPHLANASRALKSGKALMEDPAERESLLGQLAALQAMQSARTGDLAATQGWIDEARQYASGENAILILGLAWMAQANLERELGNFTLAIQAYQEALPRMPYTGILSGYWIMVTTLGQAYQVQGQLAEAEALYRSIMAQASQRSQDRMPAFGILTVNLGRVFYERNQIEEARTLLIQGEASNQRSGMVDQLADTALFGALFDRLDGDLIGAVRRLQDALNVVRRADSPNLAAVLHAWLARLQAEAGDLSSAKAWAEAIRPCPDHNPGYTHGIELSCLARVQILSGQLDQSLALVQRLEVLGRSDHDLGRVMEASMLQAEILWKQGMQAGSLSRLADCLQLARPAGYVRLFLDEGDRLSPAMACLIKSNQVSEDVVEFARQLMAGFLGKSVVDTGTVEEGVIPLTDRELEVLRALIEGLSYPDIASRLVISPGTVKTHVSHIYAKLGVQGRVEAIHKARALKIN